MKVYMSTGTGHAEDGSRYVCGLNVESALAEARAILAETEPEPYHYISSPGALNMHAHTWDHYPHGHGLKETRKALAEALAAFVES